MRGATAKSFSDALAVERLRNRRLVNFIRVLGVTLFFGLVVYAQVLKPAAAASRYTELLAAYWLASLALLAGGHYSDKVTQLSGLAIRARDATRADVSDGVFFVEKYIHKYIIQP